MATEPMNATTHHQKVKASLNLHHGTVVAGHDVQGAMEMECRADNGLGLNVMKVEVFGIQELTSRDHSATSLFLHDRTIFQDKSRPSNAVYDLPEPGHIALPQPYYTARKGRSVFPFSLTIPRMSPASVSFAKGLAKVRYEVRASVEVFWRDVRSVVIYTTPLDVVEAWTGDTDQQGKEEGETLVAEGGKMWIQGKVVGGIVVPGESACVEFWVRNHTNKKNSSLSLTLTRSLTLPTSEDPPLNLSDTLADISFRGSEYTIPPGAEGVASLVFDVPATARSVRGGTFLGEDDPRTGTRRETRALFDIRAVVKVRMGMGVGGKDIVLSIPVPIVHPLALPPPPAPLPAPNMIPYDPYAPPAANYLDLASNRATSPYSPNAYPYSAPYSPAPAPYLDQATGLVWLPPQSHTPMPYYQQNVATGGQYYLPPPPPPSIAYGSQVAGLPPTSTPPSALPGAPVGMLNTPPQHLTPPITNNNIGVNATAGLGSTVEGSGPTASRIAHHLRMTSRGRSVSPVGRRQLPEPPAQQVMANEPPAQISPPQAESIPRPVSLHIPIPQPTTKSILSPRPLLSPRSMTSLKAGLRDIEKMVEDDDAVPDPTKDNTPPAQPVPKPGTSSAEPPAKTSFFPKTGDADDVLNKTLPRPPQEEPQPQNLPSPSREFIEIEPKTPTLAPTRRPAQLLSAPVRESGLDALEKRLLEQVGTRKPAKESVRDVRDMFNLSGSNTGTKPVDIPSGPRGDEEEQNESAISSLTLAGGVGLSPSGNSPLAQLAAAAGLSAPAGDEPEPESDGDGKTRRGKSRSKSSLEDMAAPISGSRERKRKGKDKDKSKEKGRDSRDRGNVQDRRDKAKGKVAAWLGGIESPSPSDSPGFSPSPAPEDKSKQSEEQAVSPAQTESTIRPNPRSSGFVPVSTFKAKSKFLQERNLNNPAALVSKPVVGSPADEAERIADLWGSSVPPVSPFSRHHRGMAGADLGDTDTIVKNPWLTAKPQNNKLLQFPPPRANEEVKYDVRSARGGRGGLVTSVRAIWANGVDPNATPKVSPRIVAEKEKKTTPKDLMQLRSVPPQKEKSREAISSGTTTPKPFAALKKQAPPPPPPASSKPSFTSSPLEKSKSYSSIVSSSVDKDKERDKPTKVKAPQVPAVISSSHAIPTLSSTASLARPTAATSSRPRLGDVSDGARPFKKFGAGLGVVREDSEGGGGGSNSVPKATKPKYPPPKIRHGFSDLSSATKVSPSSPIKSPSSPSPAVKGLRQVNGATSGEKKPPELAFGQAKLRDLIKKYQGGS